MDVIDILGGLLGQKSSGSGKGPDILEDILRRGRRSASGQRAPSPSTTSGPTPIERQARELEDLHTVSHDRDQARRTGPSPPQRAPQRAPADTGRPVDSPFAEPRHQRRPSSRQAENLPQNEQAIHLVRENQIGCLPVVQDNHLLGILTTADFLPLYDKLVDEMLEEKRDGE